MTLSNPKVSIITIVYNSINSIRNTIQSVASQDYENIEHIIIDNCSSDGTSNAVKEQLEDISVYICEPDKGIYDALNKGIQLAVGDVIAIPVSAYIAVPVNQGQCGCPAVGGEFPPGLLGEFPLPVC